MTTRARLRFATGQFTFEAGRYLDGVTGDIPTLTYEQVTSPGLDGSRLEERRKVWPAARLQTVAFLGDWEECELIFLAYRVRVGEQATPEQVYRTASGSDATYTLLKKRVVAVDLARPYVPYVDSWGLEVIWTLQYEGGP